MCVPLTNCLTDCLPIWLLACLPVCLQSCKTAFLLRRFTRLLVCLYVCLSTFLPSYLPVCLHALSAYLPFCLVTCLSACLPACLPAHTRNMIPESPSCGHILFHHAGAEIAPADETIQLTPSEGRLYNYINQRKASLRIKNASKRLHYPSRDTIDNP